MKLVLILTALTSNGPVIERHTILGNLGPVQCDTMRDTAVVTASSDVGAILICLPDIGAIK